MPYKVSYFKVRALAEPIRMLLTYMGEEFEDIRYTFEEWQKIKSSSPFGKLPTLEIDGQVLAQSVAICRYLGEKAGLSGDNAWENLQIDITIDTFTDFRLGVSKFHHEPDPEVKEKKRQALLKEDVPFYMERFDKIVKDNNGYLANGKLSWADIYMASVSESMEAILKEKVIDAYPNLKSWREKVFNIPGIKAWLDKRPHCDI